jgi:hypothetical protein
MNTKVLSFITIICFLACGFSLAQDFEIYKGLGSTDNIASTIVEENSQGEDIIIDFIIKNKTTSEINTKIRRVSMNPIPNGFSEQLCWGTTGGFGECYLPSSTNLDYLSPDGFNLFESTTGTLSIHIEPNNNSGAIHYRYYIENSSTGIIHDSVDLKVTSTLLNVKEVKISSSLSVFPNPSNDYINLNLQGYEGASVLKIVDVLGNVVLEEKVTSSKKINVSNFKNGVYILTVQGTNNSIQTRRIVVRH